MKTFFIICFEDLDSDLTLNPSLSERGTSLIAPSLITGYCSMGKKCSKSVIPECF